MNTHNTKRTRAQYEQMHQLNLNKEEPQENKVTVTQSSANFFTLPNPTQEAMNQQNLTENSNLLNPFDIKASINKEQLFSALSHYPNALLTLTQANPSDFFLPLKQNESFSETQQPAKLIEQRMPVYSLIAKAKFHCSLSEYNFTERQYTSKGKGTLSIEATKTGEEHYVVFRNYAMNVLFQARIMPNITSITLLNRQYAYGIVVNKLIIKGDEGKLRSQAIKVKLFSLEDQNELEKELSALCQSFLAEKQKKNAVETLTGTPTDDSLQCNEKPKGRIMGTLNQPSDRKKESLTNDDIQKKKPCKLLIRCVKIDTHTSS